MADIDILVNDARVRYVAVGGQTIFPYDFPIFNASQLVVTKLSGGITTGLTNGVDYSISDIGAEAGGNVTLTLGALLNDIILNERNTPIARDTDFQQGGKISSALLNDELDLIIMILQELERDQGRTLTFSDTAPDTVSGLLPDPVASKYLRWNALANALENADVATIGAIGIPVPINQGGTGAITGPLALAALGALALAGGAMTGRLDLKQGADIASGSIVNMATATGNVIDITASNVINSLGNPADGSLAFLTFNATPTVSHNAGVAQNIFLLSGGTEVMTAGQNKFFIKRDGAWYEFGGSGSGSTSDDLYLWEHCI